VRYYWGVILSFADKDTERLAKLEHVSKFQLIERIALRKLVQLDIALTLDDLRVPPGNHLERLKGKREGQYSIRINDQYRICFIWSKLGPKSVEVCDYH
jgi:toxin HigB-1